MAANWKVDVKVINPISNRVEITATRSEDESSNRDCDVYTYQCVVDRNDTEKTVEKTVENFKEQHRAKIEEELAVDNLLDEWKDLIEKGMNSWENE